MSKISLQDRSDYLSNFNVKGVTARIASVPDIALGLGRLRPRMITAISLSIISLTASCSVDRAEEGRDAEEVMQTFISPRDSDILIADLSSDSEGIPVIGALTNLTQRPDYDNQPYFTPDASGIWYTANDPQNGQSDIWRYDFATESVTRITQSAPESEYSATALPDGSGISVIRVEADSMQRLWRFDLDGSNASLILPEIAPVGYHKWINESTVVMFVLGSPATLQVGDLETGQAHILTEDVGRSIHNIPGTGDISYVQRHEDGSATIMRLPGRGGPPERISEAVSGGDFHAWTPDHFLLMADGPLIFARRDEPEAIWKQIADFSDLHLNLSRLAVSPDGTQIALVAELDALELPAN